MARASDRLTPDLFREILDRMPIEAKVGSATGPVFENRAAASSQATGPWNRTHLPLRLPGRWTLDTRVDAQAQAQAAQAQAAQGASQIKSTFMRKVNRSLRTPMNVISGVIDMLQAATNRNAASVDSMLQTGKYACKTMVNLVQNILDTTAIEENNVLLSPVPTDLYRLCYQLVEEYEQKGSKEGKSMVFSLDYHPSCPVHAFADGVQVGRILRQLLDNAVRWTDQGLVMLSVLFERGQFVFVVRDTGRGISEAEVPFIWDRFWSANNESTGLGLWIVSRLAACMEGSVGVETSANMGSRFIVKLPLARQPVVEPAAHVVVPMPAPPGLDSISDFYKQSPVPEPRISVRRQRNRESGGGRGGFRQSFKSFELKVLYVDDNETNITVIEAMLEQFDCEVDVAVDGKQAVSMWTRAVSDPYDCIFMDCHMPRLNGFQAVEQIREAERQLHYPPVFIVGCTATLNNGPNKCLKAGMNDFIAKPIVVDELEKLLERAVEACEKRSAFS